MNEIQKYTKILVTGASGRVGSQILFEFNKAGIKPIAHVRKSSDTTFIDSLGLEKRVADLRHKDDLDKLVEGVDAIIHTAALVDFRGNKLTEFTGINTMGALYLYEAAAKAGVKRFVHVSTISAIGGISRKRNGNKEILPFANEEIEYNLEILKIPYFMTKHAAEIELWQASENCATELLMVNPSIIAAPHKSGDDYKQIKKYFNKWIIPSSPVMLNIVDLRDVAPGIIAALEKGRAGERYILGGDNISFREFALASSAFLKKIPHLVHIPRKFYDVTARFYLWVAKITGKSKIGYYPHLVRLLDYNWAYSSRKAHEELGYRWRSIHVTLDNLMTNNMVGTYRKPEQT